jgi:hypothetical protein
MGFIFATKLVKEVFTPLSNFPEIYLSLRILHLKPARVNTAWRDGERRDP